MRIMRPRRSCADALAKPGALLALQGTSAVHLVARHRVRERHLLASIWAGAAAPLGRSDLQLLHLVIDLSPAHCIGENEKEPGPQMTAPNSMDAELMGTPTMSAAPLHSHTGVPTASAVTARQTLVAGLHVAFSTTFARLSLAACAPIVKARTSASFGASIVFEVGERSLGKQLEGTRRNTRPSGYRCTCVCAHVCPHGRKVQNR